MSEKYDVVAISISIILLWVVLIIAVSIPSVVEPPVQISIHCLSGDTIILDVSPEYKLEGELF